MKRVEICEYFKLLSHPTKASIIIMLASGRKIGIQELLYVTEAREAHLKKHLDTLIEKGLIRKIGIASYRITSLGQLIFNSSFAKLLATDIQKL